MGGQPMPPTVGVALSGGGYRAALFTLGAPLYLIYAVNGPFLTAITSVSAGRSPMASSGQTTDLRSIQQSELRSRASWFASRITAHGAVFAALSVRWQRFTWLATACDDPPPPPEKWGDQESENASSGSAVSTADSEGARRG